MPIEVNDIATVPPGWSRDGWINYVRNMVNATHKNPLTQARWAESLAKLEMGVANSERGEYDDSGDSVQ